jgi:hypothetical protein
MEISMKIILAVLVLGSVTTGVPAFASLALPAGQAVIAQEIYHGGGCRKASPKGQCCHAGSKPYHCH